MIEVRKYTDARGRKAFLSVPGVHCCVPGEKQYLKSVLTPSKNVLFRACHAAYFVAFDDGLPAGRIFVWCRDTDGFFALLDGVCPEVLLEKAEEYVRQFGCTVLAGPFCCCPSFSFAGVLTYTEKPTFKRAALTPLIGNVDWRVYCTADMEPAMGFKSYELQVGAVNPMHDKAEKAKKRFSLTVCRLYRGIGKNTLPNVAYEIEHPGNAAAAIEAERCLPLTALSHSFCVRGKNGELLGYVMCLKGEVMRVSTLITKQKDTFSPPVTLCLISAVWDSLIKKCVSSVEASVIDTENEASIRVVERLGGTLKCQYDIFQKSIT